MSELPQPSEKVLKRRKWDRGDYVPLGKGLEAPSPYRKSTRHFATAFWFIAAWPIVSGILGVLIVIVSMNLRPENALPFLLTSQVVASSFAAAFSVIGFAKNIADGIYALDDERRESQP